MQDAGWTRADDVTLVSSGILSTITRRSLRGGTRLPLKIFGKTQAFAYRRKWTAARNATMCASGKPRTAGCCRAVTRWIGWQRARTTPA